MNADENHKETVILCFDPEDKEIASDVRISCGEKSVTVRALWDTGANKSSVAWDIIEQLEAVSCRDILRITDIDTTTEKVYMLNLHISPSMEFNGIEMVRSSIGSRKCKAIIGMDIIMKGQFVFINNNGKYFAAYTYNSKGE